MNRAVKIFLPLLVTFAVGVLISRVSHFQRSECKCVTASKDSRIEVRSVPKIDFTESAKHSPGLQVSVKLRLLVDENGNVENVTASQMVPYGESQKFEQGGPNRHTAMTMDGKFVDTLPYQLFDVAVDLARNVKFKPQVVNGVAHDHVVHAIVDFEPFEMVEVYCNPIRVTFFDDRGEFWSGNASIYRDCGQRNSAID